MSFDRDAFLKRLAGVRAGVERRGLTMTGYRVRGDGVIVPDTKPRRRRVAAAAPEPQPQSRRGVRARPVQENLF